MALAGGAARGQVPVQNNASYIDSAQPFTNFRLRTDLGYDNSSANRAEFIYARPAPFGPGFPRPEPRIDAQDLSAYLEYAFGETFSAFVEVPWRWINPRVNANANGLADTNAGFKWAMIAEEEGILTFQFRTYAPTGDAGRGLGTRHASLEPALLGTVPVGEGGRIEMDLRYWVPVGGTEFAGSVIRAGLGLSQHVYDCDRLHVIPMAELISWTALGGKVGQVPVPGAPPIVEGAAGDTIVHARIGVRIRLDGVGDFYTGYGRALTGDRWYRDDVRAEFRFFW
jgi:hypothetical protein